MFSRRKKDMDAFEQIIGLLLVEEKYLVKDKRSGKSVFRNCLRIVQAGLDGAGNGNDCFEPFYFSESAKISNYNTKTQ